MGADRRRGPLRSIGALALVLLSSALPARGLAQRGPVFQLQPGISVLDFVSVAEGTRTNSAFSLRFATRFPSGRAWLTPVIGAVFFPYGSTENTIRNTDAPTLFAGNIFSLLPESRTAGWMSVEVPLLIAHTPGSGPTGSVRDYGRDLVISPTVYIHLGARALRELGAIWSRLTVLALIEQNLTPNRAQDGSRDRFNPTATVGVSLNVGPRN